MKKLAVRIFKRFWLFFGLFLASAPFAHANTLELVSVSSTGEEGTFWSSDPAISADGRFVAFASDSPNLVPNDTVINTDIFVRDLLMGLTERVSLASDGTPGNLASSYPSISADGRYVAFMSGSNNLVSGDTNGLQDAFVHDRVTRTTERVSVATDGTQANNSIFYPSMSANGRYVAFVSAANNLVSGDTNGTQDIFVHDRETRTTERVSVASDGTQGISNSNSPSLSADGRYVVFASYSSNLVAGDTNNMTDVFLHDRETKLTKLASINDEGAQGNSSSDSPSISGDGRFVVFRSSSSNLDLEPYAPIGWRRLFIHDLLTGQTEYINVNNAGALGNSDCFLWRAPAINHDGRFVVFQSNSRNLVSATVPFGVEQIYLRDRQTGTTELISVNTDVVPGDGSSEMPAISSDGKVIAFRSQSTNFVSLNNLYPEHIYVVKFDNDNDGYNSTEDCNDNDPSINPGAYEECDKIDNNCDGQIDEGYDVDGDGYTACDECDDNDAGSNPSAPEVCDGLDNNCDGLIDEGFDVDNDGYTVCEGDCNDNNASVFPGASETKHDGIDQDCNGYDLTINVTVADYVTAESLLTVKATSARGAEANLEMVGYGPMTWKANQQAWVISFTGSNPGSVTVSGPEGSESKSVTVE